MITDVIDRSKYLKGLLVLAKQDRVLETTERNYIRTVAQRIGFGEDFYEEALRGLMVNKYITEEPIVFSNASVAESFIKDGVTLALIDNKMDTKEKEWLEKIAVVNNISESKQRELFQFTDASNNKQ